MNQASTKRRRKESPKQVFIRGAGTCKILHSKRYGLRAHCIAGGGCIRVAKVLYESINVRVQPAH